ncbi:MAG: HPr(Ser) kinase/phosphatase [Clostridia bacterium]|nr:HPr(Ser) kinase/phosphatase [Clostridia bacterium]
MDSKYTVSLSKVVKDQNLEVMTCQELLDNIVIECPDINRPGLELAGYCDNFANDRIQLIGNVEMQYINSLTETKLKKSLTRVFKLGFPCVVIARNLQVPEIMLDLSNRYKVPVLRTKEATTAFHSELNRYLSVQLAPREVVHACFVEVYGEGVLITGKSGVGKSETALELVKRGHRLVADDLVEIRRVSSKTLVGSAPDIIRHFIEIRGVGFLDVKRLYGIGAVKMTENIQLVIDLEKWEAGKTYGRLGIEDVYTDILGIKVPSVSIPVMPGRNLAIIVEVAAMNNRQKMMGYNAAKELNRRVFETGRGAIKGGSYDGDIFY